MKMLPDYFLTAYFHILLIGYYLSTWQNNCYHGLLYPLCGYDLWFKSGFFRKHE